MNALVRLFRLWNRMNWLLTATIVLLLAIGIFFVYSATSGRDEVSVRMLYQKQMVWAAAGLAAYFAVTAFDYRRLCNGSRWFYALSLLLLVVVLIHGTRIYGARRWLMMFGIGVQPSEIAKLAFIMITAWYMGQPAARNDTYGVFWIVVALAAAPFYLIFREPDLGTAMIFVPVALAMLFVGGAPARPLALVAGFSVAIAITLFAVIFLADTIGLTEARQERVLAYTGLSDYQRERIMVFLNADRDPHGAGWNRLQSAIAIGAGGMTGRGYLQGTQNTLGFLPKTVAPTDFIFPVIAEEMGFMGAAAVLGLFAVLLLCVVLSALDAADTLGRLLCTGILAMIFGHIAVNVSMTVGLMPIAGVPLPLVSYGGTFVVAILVALGLVQSVYVRRSADRGL